MKEKLKALSVRQPYAEAIIDGRKKIEYRSHETHVREVIYIYASLTREDEYLGGGIYQTTDHLPIGVIIGTVEVYDCRVRKKNKGQFEWLLRNPRRFAKPIKPNLDEHPQPIWFYPFGKPEEVKPPKISGSKKVILSATWVQYHNCDNRGVFPGGVDIEAIANPERIDLSKRKNREMDYIYTTKKNALRTAGEQVVLIAGIGSPKKFYAWCLLKVKNVEFDEDDGEYLLSGKFTYPSHPILLNKIPGFSDLKHFCGNFGIGLQNISKHDFAVVLRKLIA